MDAVVFSLGAILISLVGVQVGLLTWSSFRNSVHDRQLRQLSLDLLRERIEAAKVFRVQREQAEMHWNGYRKFVVDRKVYEAADICSFYFVPHDGHRLPIFKPGQFLTFRLRIPGRDKPVIRCYSLSDGPWADYYRVTIKRIGPPANQPDDPPGLVSSYFHDLVREGDILDVQAPSGHFFLDPQEQRPVVLIAGGVGITPMLSMVNTIAQQESGRRVWLFYGVRNGREQAMKEHLHQLPKRHENLRVVHCYSRPTELDDEERDYHHAGHLSVELLKQYLETNNYQFYICGPPGMMQSMTTQLRDWGVSPEDILTEAFGPATVSKAFAIPQAKQTATTDPATTTDVAVKITFGRSGKVCNWNPAAENLLDFALANEVLIDSGCRAGNCGTCLVALKSGKVKYLTEYGAEVEQGACLTCISVPDGNVVLDA